MSRSRCALVCARACLALIVLAIAAPLAAQTISGRVVDSATQSQIFGVNVALLDGRDVVATTRTDDSGSFRITAARPGRYQLRLRLVGFEPVTTEFIQLAANATIGPTVYAMKPSVVQLDTVTARASTAGLFVLTPGREFFRRHSVLNTGIFISGFEIQRSKMSVTAYLGTLPGLRFTSFVSEPAPGADQATSPPTIPGKEGFLLSSFESKCLYGRIDRWSIPKLLEQQSANDIEDLISVEDIMGVEVYQTSRQVPAEWRSEASLVQLVWRIETGRRYLMGEVGTPGRRFSIRASPRDPPDSRTRPAEIHSVRGPGSMSGLGGKMLTDTIQSEFFSLPSMISPGCGFVQIWTRIAW